MPEAKSPQPEGEFLPGPLPADFHALIERARAGDSEALGALLERSRARLRRIVSVRLGGRLLPQLETLDIVADTHLLALRKLREMQLNGLEFENSGALLAWLAQIATNCARDALRARETQMRDHAREVPLTSGIHDHLREDSERLPDPATRIARGELRDLVDQTVAELPDKYREVVLLRDYAGLDWTTIAERIGSVTLPAARQLHARAWTKLRKKLQPSLFGWD